MPGTPDVFADRVLQQRHEVEAFFVEHRRVMNIAITELQQHGMVFHSPHRERIVEMEAVTRQPQQHLLHAAFGSLLHVAREAEHLLVVMIEDGIAAPRRFEEKENQPLFQGRDVLLQRDLHMYLSLKVVSASYDARCSFFLHKIKKGAFRRPF